MKFSVDSSEIQIKLYLKCLQFIFIFCGQTGRRRRRRRRETTMYVLKLTSVTDVTSFRT